MSSSSAPYGAGQVPELAPPGKKAIPRLQRSGQALPPAKDRRRVSRACTACRTHKIKCSGETPLCKHCQSTGRDCIYILPRKDRLKNVTERCNQMAAYLRVLKGFAGEEDGLKIGELLDAVDEDATMAAGPPLSNPDTDGDDQSHGYLEGVASEVNIDSLDLLDENLHVNHRSLATGFIGKNSEVQWLRTLLTQEHYRDDLSRQVPERQGASTSGAIGDQVSSLSFYLDGEFDRDFFSDQWGDPYALPSLDVAKQFLRNYMDTVHDSFPILHRKVFEDQVDRLYSGIGHPTMQRVNPKWGAMLNLVFAIGARYSHLGRKTQWEADARDHLIYQSKARYLGWNSSTLWQHPDLPQIQIAGMLAFYYLSVGQVSRAWVVVGMALRFAVALGLHVRNEDPSTSTPKRESLLRIWWALYSLDRQLSIITGRPSVVVDSCCSVPLPMPFPEDEIKDDMETINRMRRASTMSTATSTSTLAPTSPTYTSQYLMGGLDGPRNSIAPATSGANSGSYFKAVVQMGIITQSILSSLYTAGTMIRPSGELQHDIVQLNRRLDDWVAALPTDFDFSIRRSGVSTPTRSHFRERTLLGFQFYSAKILLTRPYFSGGSQSRKDAKDVTASAGISRPTSLCVDAAKAELDMLPDQPTPLFLYNYGPWWCIVHYLMQALAVLLLALDSSTASSHDRGDLAAYLKKIVRWLRSMNDMTARTAYRIAFRSFDIVAKRASIPIEDMWAEHSLHERNTGPDVMGAANVELGGYEMDTCSGYGPSVQAFVPVMSISAPHPSISTSLFPNPLAMPTTFPSQPGEPLVNDSFYDSTN